MKSLFRAGLCFGFCLFVCGGISIAASSGHPAFDQRLSEVGLMYSLPSGFIDDGPNVALEKELNATSNSASPFVVHQIRSTDGKIAAYVDIRVLGMNLANQALAISYPIVFAANAAKYCESVSGGSCSVESTLPSEAVRARYHADLGMVFNSDHPNPTRIGGRKKARVFAISKPDKGIFYLTITYDVDEELETNYKALTRMLKFN